MDGAVLSGMTDVFILGFPIVISEEVLIYNCVNIGVTWGFNRWLSEVRLMPLSFNGERAEKLLGLVEGFLDG